MDFGYAQPESWWPPALAPTVAPDSHCCNNRVDVESGQGCTVRAADDVVIMDEAGGASVLEQAELPLRRKGHGDWTTSVFLVGFESHRDRPIFAWRAHGQWKCLFPTVCVVPIYL